MFIDRKINGALIQDLAQKGWGCKCEGWWKSNRQRRKNWRGRKGLVRWGRKRSDDELSRWPLSGMSSRMCEQPVVAFFLFLSIRTALECTWTSGKWNLRRGKNRKEQEWRGERKGKERKGGRKINFPEQRQAGLMEDWKKKRRRRRGHIFLWLPPIGFLANLKSWHGHSQQPHSSDLFLGGMESWCFF